MRSRTSRSGASSSHGCSGAGFSSASEGIIVLMNDKDGTRSASLRSHRDRRASAWQALSAQSKKLSASAASAAFIVVLCCTRLFAAGRPITVTDLLSLHRVSDPQVSPDGARVLYTAGVPDVPNNRTARDIWLVTVATGDAKALTSGGRESDGRWSPDGRRVAFISSRAGNEQLFVMNADGSDAKAVSPLSGGVANIVWAPDGRSIAFTSEVFPDCRDEACSAARDKERDESKSKARIYDRLLYRHWSTWSEGKRSHPFVVELNGGAPRDLLPGADYDVPPREREGPHRRVGPQRRESGVVARQPDDLLQRRGSRHDAGVCDSRGRRAAARPHGRCVRRRIQHRRRRHAGRVAEQSGGAFRAVRGSGKRGGAAADASEPEAAR